MITGAELIANERRHQVEDRGFTVEHDQEHASHGLLVDAAAHFLECARGRRDPRTPWPFVDDSLSCKPRGISDPVHDLVKAGGLIAAETDRLLAMA